MTKRILVTGAGGYIGRHVVTDLLNRGMDVSVVDFRTDGIDERAEVIDENIFSGAEDIYDRLKRPAVVIHMAWRDGFVHNSPAHIDDLAAHAHFIEHLYKGGLKQLVVMGTMHEVGYWEGAIKADTPTNPESMYGIGKNALRGLTALYAKQNDAIMQWVRAYYIVGDDARGNSIFSKLYRAVQEGKKTFPFTTGKNLYDFISVDELAHQIAAVALQTEVDGVINAATGKPMSLADRVEKYIVDNNLDISLDYGAFPDRPYDSPGVWADVEKITKVLSITG
ncbi:NAD-dependent epimerase/dehydratase family protein [Arcanobacterium bovis]|uniref:NAD(P)-dependent oxidoreductase n=1 Tax=Arcanobacterium bovis TaxID=2529275 RepID=A0A4Q9V1Y2_9ACTO|nr:NAD(P)-dependent oxidoreductase [Arcanobacterium bovis]TBW23639.1 NAD(P)-dependent oxidoreductase [Arcanobacterium bovis]